MIFQYKVIKIFIKNPIFENVEILEFMAIIHYTKLLLTLSFNLNNILKL